MPRKPILVLTPEKIEQARLVYEAGVRPVDEVGDMLAMKPGRFLSFRKKNGWALRPSPIKRRGADAGLPDGAAGGASSRRLVARLEDAVEREFTHAEAALAKRNPKAIEARARALASLVRSLAELKRMSRDGAPSPGEAREGDERTTDESSDTPPRQLAELRAELARRLERLRGDGEAR